MLSEIYQIEKDKHCIISPMCGIFKTPELIKTRDWCLLEAGVGFRGGVEKWVTLVKRYKLAVLGM